MMALLTSAWQFGLTFAVRLVHLVLLLGAIGSFGPFATSVQAQTAEGVIGWYSTAGPAGSFPSAYEACHAQWLAYNAPPGSPKSRFIGAKPDPENWSRAACAWTIYQYLCPEEAQGGISACGTIFPAGAVLECAAGYTPTVDGHCRKTDDLAPECRACGRDNGGRLNPSVGNPIVLATGSKLIATTDYEAADGRFRIGRIYRSFQVGTPLDGFRLPRALPRWLAGSWNFDFGYEIQLGIFSGSPANPDAKIAVLVPDGTGILFVLQSNGQWVPDPASGASNVRTDMKLEYIGTLPSDLATIKAGVSNWRLTDNDDTVWAMRTAIGPNGNSYNTGWPVTRTERDGYTWTFTYNSDTSLASIADSFGRTATFGWHQYFTSILASPPAGSLPYPTAVSSIVLPDGTSLRYTYDPQPALTPPSTLTIKRLVKFERLSAASAVLDSETYLYEDAAYPTHVTGVTDNRGLRVATYAYDTRGRAISTEGGNGTDRYAVEYSETGGSLSRRATNALGKASNYTFGSFTGGTPDFRLSQVAGEASADTPASSNAVGYAADTFVSITTDDEGRITTYVRDAKGRPTTMTEGSGTSSQRITTITWHPTLNVPATIIRPGVTETHSYNGIGQLSSITLTDTTSHSVPYSTNGQTRTYTYGYTPSGRLLSINGPLAANGQGQDDLTSFTYDTQGNLLTMTNPMGHVTNYGSYDANGRPGTVTDPNGIVTTYAYDAMGRVTTLNVKHPTTASLDAITTIAYDAVGNVTGITLPSTDMLIMDYNAAGQLTAMRAANGERREYSYDAMGNITREVVKRTNSTIASDITRTFDQIGRMIGQATGLYKTSRWAYDKVGNPVQTKTPAGHATTQAFDPLDRLVTTVAPDSGNTTRTFDARDNLVGLTDPKSVTTQFVRNGFDDVIREVSPDRGTSTYWYDAAGQLIKSSDGRGQVIDYTRDTMGRLLQKVPAGRPASEIVTYTWDAGGASGTYGIGRIGKIVDGTGTTQFKHDHRGNLLIKQQAIGTSTTAKLVYAYDLADRITQITYPSGRIVQYAYDTKGRVTRIQTKATAAVSTWTQLTTSSATYEPFGAVKVRGLGNGLTVANDWGNDGRLASRRLYRTSDGTNLSWLTYVYDMNDNIASITDQLNGANSVLYGYDVNDRLRLTAVGPTGTPGTGSYGYAAGTNRLASMATASGTRSITYDARGNMAGESRPGGVSATTGYDGYARLTSYVRTGSGTLTFSYNGLDDRVAMGLATGTRRFIYDPDGRVMGEYGASATDVKAEFVWALPEVANDNAVFGGDDGVGGYAPVAVATPDAGGAIVLNWVHGNHMGVPLVTTDSAGNPATTPNDYLAPGFPGQSRVLADLYYNRYRDFDPSTGRYIQADPIGLEGGSNIYVYAENNPLRWSDPDGRLAFLLIPGLCTGGGCETIGAGLVLFTAWWLGPPECLPDQTPTLESKRKGERNWAGSPDGTPNPNKGIRGVPGRPGWGQRPNPQTGKKGSPKPWSDDPRLKK